MIAKRKLNIVFLLVLTFAFSVQYAFAGISPLKVTFIDVGHGDCILIQTPDDGGPVLTKRQLDWGRSNATK